MDSKERKTLTSGGFAAFTSEFRAFGQKSVTTAVGSPVRSLGKTAIGIFDYLSGMLGLLYATIVTALVLRGRGMRVIGGILVNQIRFTGVHAITPVTFASLAIGAMILIQGILYLPPDLTVSLSAMILVKEVTPMLTALILIGRSGTAIAIELGNMKLNHELDALTSMGIPLEHVVMLPRLLGMVISFLALAVYSAAGAVIGGYAIARAANVAPVTFTLTELVSAITVAQVAVATLKVCLFGAVIAITSIMHGMSVKFSVREIPIVTTQAVVKAMITCIAINSFISIYM